MGSEGQMRTMDLAQNFVLFLLILTTQRNKCQSLPFCRWTNWGWSTAILAWSGLEPDSHSDLHLDLSASAPRCPATRQHGFLQGTASRNGWISEATCWEVLVPHCLPVVFKYYSSGLALPGEGWRVQNSAKNSQMCPASPRGVIVGSHREPHLGCLRDALSSTWGVFWWVK